MEIIVLIIIISLLSLILFIALKKVINNITRDSKEYYLQKIQDYDEKILEKEKELKNLESSEVIIKEEDKKNKKVIEKASVDKNLIEIVNHTEYSNENALREANKVDEIFVINEEKIIRDFLAKVKDNEDNKILQKLYDRFSPELIYKLKMLNNEAQKNEIIKMISAEEKEIFNSYLEKHKYRLNKFLLDLQLVIENTTPIVEVLVGNKNKNYDYISPYIRTIYSDDIYKGFIIKYQDYVYDYSINERDV